MGKHENIKPSNYRHRRGRRLSSQWHRPDLLQDLEVNFPKLRKETPKQIQATLTLQTRPIKKKSPQNIIVKPVTVQNKESTLETARKKHKVNMKETLQDKC